MFIALRMFQIMNHMSLEKKMFKEVDLKDD